MIKLDPQNIKRFKNIAIVGASNNPEKYGYRAAQNLIDAGYTVFPVNPHEDTILGQRVFHNLTEIEGEINLVVFVTKPSFVLEALQTVLDKDIRNVWFQPGSESEEAINFCEANNIAHIEKACIIIDRLDS